MPVGAIVAGGLGLVGSAMSASASKKAANAQAEAASQAAQVQRDAAVQSRIDAYPWALSGASALYSYMDQLGIPRPQTPILPDLNSGPFAATSPAAPAQNAQPAQPNALGSYGGVSGRSGGREGGVYYPQPQRQAVQPQVSAAAPAAPSIASPQNLPMTAALGFRETPGYQFQIEQGERGVTNNLSALGMKNSGAALKALTRFRQGLADQTYNDWLNRIAGVAGLGQTQTNTTNALMSNAAGNIGQAMSNAGEARASGYVGAANAWSKGLENVGSALGQASYQQFPNAPSSGGLY